ncbi:MAG: hypothetical protein H0Z34_08465 [Brevibacillus sp.]|nr:hypothetical protein [Brevibacillus sp.]
MPFVIKKVRRKATVVADKASYQVGRDEKRGCSRHPDRELVAGANQCRGLWRITRPEHVDGSRPVDQAVIARSGKLACGSFQVGWYRETQSRP